MTTPLVATLFEVLRLPAGYGAAWLDGEPTGVTDAAPERRLAGTSSSFRNPKKLATFGQPDP
jgi:hypothetical protein